MTATDGSVSLADLTLRGFLDATAARSPVPGGGAVAATVLATGAALGRMVLAYTIGKPRFAESAEQLQDAERRLAVHQSALLALADEDAGAYGRLNALQRAAAGSAGRAGIPAALLAAIEAPLRMAEIALDAEAVLRSLEGATNPHLASDLAIALDLVQVGRRAALHNVEVNLPALTAEGGAIPSGLEPRLARVRRG